MTLQSQSSPRIQWLLEHGEVGQTYLVRGWVRTCRGSKNVSFIAINDGSCGRSIQAVVPSEMTDYQASMEGVSTGASVAVEGVLIESPGKGQKVELQATSVTVLGLADPEKYPLQKKGHSMEFMRSIAHLRPRANAFGAVFRIRATLASATHAFFNSRGFAYVHTPIITASDCEGAGEMFEVKASQGGQEHFFGRPAMLTVSGQLNAEAMAYGLGNVYTFGPTFRAENSHTARHLSEFWMIEPEMAFYDLDDDMDLAEGYLRHLIDAVIDQNADDLDLLNRFVDKTLIGTLETARTDAFVRITYTDAIKLLEGSGEHFEFPVSWGVDLQTEHERFLTETYFKRPVAVYDYPRDIKAFYMFGNDDEKTVRAVDVLVPRIGEIIGGSQREHRIEVLEQRLVSEGLLVEDYSWYLDLNRFGGVPHSGFGMGFERAVMFCTGMSNIRDVIPFPRAPGAASF